MALNDADDAMTMDVIDLSSSSPPPEPVGLKRKAKAVTGNDASQSPEKKARTEEANGHVEVKGRKLVFYQEPYQRFVPRRRLLKLEELLLDAEEEGKELDAIPDEFFDVIAMAGHELTSNSEASFVKHLKAELKNDTISADLLLPLIPKLFTLHQYGFLPSDFNVAASKLPAGLQIRCWEVNDVDKYFPADRIPDIQSRRAERARAREECVSLLDGLDDAEKAEVLKGEKDLKADTVKNAPMAKAEARHNSASPNGKDTGGARKSREGTAASDRSRRSASPAKRPTTAEDDETARKRKEEREAKKAEREEKRKEQEEKKAEREAAREAKKAEQEEKRKELEEKRKEQEEKRKEQEEKKAAKEREEQKKKALKQKQAKVFGSFFKKATPKPQPVISRATEAGPSSSKPAENDFQRAFKPPPRRANVEWAPLNRWNPSGGAEKPVDVSGWTPRDFINDHLQRHKLSTQQPRSHLPRGLKSAPLHGSVAEVWAEHQEAADPRAVLSLLGDNDRFPWKTLAFDQQVRPPYSGTFTKKSVVVGPRTPLAQDPMFDYSYDSGDDWEDDEGGEDVDEPEEEAPVEVDSDEEEGEFDDWLDNEEDIIFADTDGDVPMPDASPSRLPFKTETKKKIVPKRVTKLAPYWRGPVWESQDCESVDGLEPYRIQLLNDTPECIDPFKYESPEPAQCFKTTYSDMAVGVHLGVPCLLAAAEVAPPKVPPKPMPLGDASSSANATPATASTAAPTNVLKARPAPKVAFPASHVPELLRMIDGSPKILSDLISHLKAHFDSVATKAAIDAKIREVATRVGKGKDMQWRVKAEAWSAAGVAAPARGIAAMVAGTVSQ